MKRSYSIKQLAILMGKAERTVDRYISSGALQVERIGHRYLVDEEALQAFIPGQLAPDEPEHFAASLGDMAAIVQRMESKIEAQDVRIQELERMLQEIQDSPAPARARYLPTERQAPSMPLHARLLPIITNLPDGVIMLTQFAAMHGVARSTLI